LFGCRLEVSSGAVVTGAAVPLHTLDSCTEYLMGVESVWVGRGVAMIATESNDAPEKPYVTLPGKVEKIIPGPVPAIPDKAQIAVYLRPGPSSCELPKCHM
jgi:hypothetical protein